MDRIEKHRREVRERRLLESIEKAQLVASGAAPQAAETQARAAADAMVQAAGQVREAEKERVRIGSRQQTGPAPVNVRAAVLTPDKNPLVFVPDRRDPLARLISLVAGPHVRAAIASLLLAGCALWAHQNGLVPGAEMQTQAKRAMESHDLSGLHETAARDLYKSTSPLKIAGVPAPATSWLDGWNAGVAGLLLFGSLFYRGNVMSIFVLLGAAVAAVGHQYGIRTVEPLRAEHISLMLGSVLALIGYRASD